MCRFSIRRHLHCKVSLLQQQYDNCWNVLHWVKCKIKSSYCLNCWIYILCDEMHLYPILAFYLIWQCRYKDSLFYYSLVIHTRNLLHVALKCAFFFNRDHTKVTYLYYDLMLRNELWSLKYLCKTEHFVFKSNCYAVCIQCLFNENLCTDKIYFSHRV